MHQPDGASCRDARLIPAALPVRQREHELWIHLVACRRLEQDLADEGAAVWVVGSVIAAFTVSAAAAALRSAVVIARLFLESIRP